MHATMSGTVYFPASDEEANVLLKVAKIRGWRVLPPPNTDDWGSVCYERVVATDEGVVTTVLSICAPPRVPAGSFAKFLAHLNAGPPQPPRKIVRCDWTMHEGGDGTNLIVTARNPEGTRLALPYSILRKILATWPDAKLPGTGATEESPF